MSSLVAIPQLLSTAASDVAAVGSSVDAAHTAAAAQTVAVLPAAADEVSGTIAQLFSQVGLNYQALAGQAAAFNSQFVQNLTASAGSYVAAEASNVASMFSGIGSSVGATAAALSDTVLSSLTAVWNSIVQGATIVWNALNILGGLAYILAYLSLMLAWLVLNFGALWLQSQIASLFGVMIPIASLSL